MKNEPKWQDPKVRSFAKSGCHDCTIDLGDGNSSPSGPAEKRPLGRDKSKVAKKKAKSSAGSASSTEYASKMQGLSLQKISMMQKETVHINDRFQKLACIDEKRYEEMRSHNQSLIVLEQEKIQLMREKHDMDKEDDEDILHYYPLAKMQQQMGQVVQL